MVIRIAAMDPVFPSPIERPAYCLPIRIHDSTTPRIYSLYGTGPNVAPEMIVGTATLALERVGFSRAMDLLVFVSK